MLNVMEHPDQADQPSTPPTHDEAGVDLTLVRWMLSLTPAERLQVLQDNLYSILRLRGGYPDET